MINISFGSLTMSVERVSKSSFQAAEKEGEKREKRETHHVSQMTSTRIPSLKCTVACTIPLTNLIFVTSFRKINKYQDGAKTNSFRSNCLLGS
jgi:hypothetical protein